MSCGAQSKRGACGPFPAVFLALLALLAPGCGQEEKRDISGNSPVFIELLLTSPNPLSYPRSPQSATALATFAYVDPYADLSTGVLLLRRCGEEPEERQEIPFSFVSEEVWGVGTFGLRLKLPADCAEGGYPFRVFVLDESGRASNQIEMRYEITP